jgi:hypothetical protein
VRHYVLDERGEPKAEDDLFTWARWYESADRRVAQDFIGNVRVSTVFLSLDHNLFGEGLPVLWETMIFGGEHDQFQRRYTSRVDALLGHEYAVNVVRGRVSLGADS